MGGTIRAHAQTLPAVLLMCYVWIPLTVPRARTPSPPKKRQEDEPEDILRAHDDAAGELGLSGGITQTNRRRLEGALL